MSLTADFCYKKGSTSLDISLSAGDGPIALYGGTENEHATLFQCLCGTIKPNRGRIQTNGVVWYDSVLHQNVKQKQRNLQVLCAKPMRHPKWSAERMMATCNPGNVPWALEVMRRMQLEHLAQKTPAAMTKLQKFQLSVALAVAQEPDLILLDERMLSMDEAVRWKQEMILLDALQLYTGTFFFAAITRSAVYRLCRRVCVLQRGKMRQQFDVSILFERPDTLLASKLAGYQNVTPIQRMDESHVFAPAWNTVLKLESVPEDAYYLGIRAHACCLADAPGPNVIGCKVKRKMKQLDSVTVVALPDGAEHTQLILDLPKDSDQETDHILVKLPEQALMPLR